VEPEIVTEPNWVWNSFEKHENLRFRTLENPAQNHSELAEMIFYASLF
jgi:hypothetical protein